MHSMGSTVAVYTNRTALCGHTQALSSSYCPYTPLGNSVPLPINCTLPHRHHLLSYPDATPGHALPSRPHRRPFYKPERDFTARIAASLLAQQSLPCIPPTSLHPPLSRSPPSPCPSETPLHGLPTTLPTPTLHVQPASRPPPAHAVPAQPYSVLRLRLTVGP